MLTLCVVPALPPCFSKQEKHLAEKNLRGRLTQAIDRKLMCGEDRDATWLRAMALGKEVSTFGAAQRYQDRQWDAKLTRVTAERDFLADKRAELEKALAAHEAQARVLAKIVAHESSSTDRQPVDRYALYS